MSRAEIAHPVNGVAWSQMHSLASESRSFYQDVTCARSHANCPTCALTATVFLVRGSHSELPTLSIALTYRQLTMSHGDGLCHTHSGLHTLAATHPKAICHAATPSQVWHCSLSVTDQVPRNTKGWWALALNLSLGIFPMLYPLKLQLQACRRRPQSCQWTDGHLRTNKGRDQPKHSSKAMAELWVPPAGPGSC